MRGSRPLTLAVVFVLLVPGHAVADDVDQSPVTSFTVEDPSFGPAYGIARQPSTGDIWVVHGESDQRVMSAYRANSTGSPDPLIFFQVCNDARFPAFNAAGTEIVLSCYSDGTVMRYYSDTGYAVGPALTGAGSPMGAAFAPNGDIVVPNVNGDAVYVYRPDQSAQPIKMLTSAAIDGPSDIAVAPDGTIYVLNLQTTSVSVFPADANGHLPSLRTIALSGVGEVYALALDGADNIYVAGFTGGVVVYPALSGSTQLKHLSGPKSGLSGVLSLLVDPQRRVVIGELPGRVATFAALVPFRVPGVIGSLRVAGAKTAKKRTVTWAAPASQGDRPVTGYLVVVRKGSKTLMTKTLATRSMKLKRARLPQGKLTVSVQARSSAGLSKPVAVKFRVKQPT